MGAGCAAMRLVGRRTGRRKCDMAADSPKAQDLANTN